MSISEQRYRAWCESMASKAALEQRIALHPPTETIREVGNDRHLFFNKDDSDQESFHSTHSQIRDETISPKSRRRRRTMSDPRTPAVDEGIDHGGVGTWPRSARTSFSQPHAKSRPPIVSSRRSSHLSAHTRNREDLRAFHRESCQLFSSMDAQITDSGYSSIRNRGSSTFNSTSSIPLPSIQAETSPRPSTTLVRPPLSTGISWKSDATRRVEYSKIDGAHSGLRGLCKKVLPKYCQSRRSWRKFFDGKCDGDSVRRMRMPFSDDNDDDEKAGL